MKLNRTWAMAAAIVMALTLSLSGTLAYLSDTDADVNVMTLGNVQITQNEQERVKDENGKFTTELQAFTNNQVIYPAVYGVTGMTDPARQQITVGEYTHTAGLRAFPNYVDKIVTVTNTGKSDAYVRTMIAIPSKNTVTAEDVSEQWLHYNPITDTDTNPSNGWYAGKTQADGDWDANKNYLYNITINGNVYEVYTATNVNVLAPGKTTGPCLAGFYLDNSVNYVDGAYVDVKGDKVWEEDTLEILVISQAVQAAGFADAYTALNAGYGEVNSENVTKWFNALYNKDGTVNDDMIGTPGEDNDTNNPPYTLVNNLEELLNADGPITASAPLALEDDTTVEKAITVGNGGELELNLATKTLSNSNADNARLFTNNGGEAIISNGTMTGGSAATYSNVTSGKDATTTYTNVNIQSAGGGIGATDGATVTFNGGSVEVDSKSTSGRYLFYAEDEGSTIIINDGHFDFNKTQNQKRAYIYAGSGATVEVNGGTFGKASTRKDYTAGIMGSGTVIIKGGTFGFDPSNWVAAGYKAEKSDDTWTVSAITE